MMCLQTKSSFSVVFSLSALLCLSAYGLGGCNDSISDSDPITNTTSDTAGGTSDDTDAINRDTDAINDAINDDSSDLPLCTSSPTCDTDGDGIPDAIEAATGTDPFNPDSDGDGVCDGDHEIVGVCCAGEDLNNNGLYEPSLGETNPRDPDQNGNGIPDGNDDMCGSRSIVCNTATYTAVTASPARSAETNLAWPNTLSITMVDHPSASASAFSDPTHGIYGYVIKRNFTQPPALAFRDFETKISAAGSKRSNAIMKAFTTWLGKLDGLDRNGMQSKGSFSFGASSDNPGEDEKDPAALRDQIISAISGTTVTTEGVRGAPCEKIISYHVEERRDANTVVSIGVLACEADHALPTTKLFFDDMLSSTSFAIATQERAYLPRVTGCERLAGIQAGGVVDFLWIVDNSGSMADEQANITATAQGFMDLLLTSPVDWRIAVTTTDAYCLGVDPNNLPSYLTPELLNLCKAQLDQDPVRDACTGLRGRNGFMSSATPDVRTKFEDLVSKNSACLNPVDADPGANVCGFGLASGLLSADFVIEQLQRADLGSECGFGPAYQLRKGTDAKTVVIFVSDKEDAEMIDHAGSGTPYSPDDPIRRTRTDAYIEQFTHTIPNRDNLDLRFYAMITDQGAAGSGVCGLNGATYGQSYQEVAEASGGAVGSICADDLSATIEAIIRDTIGQVSSYPIGDDVWPIASSIRVAIGDTEISRIDNGVDPYWEYVVETNSITFFRLFIPAGVGLTIGLITWGGLE